MDTAAGSLVIAVASQEKRAEMAGPAFSCFLLTAISYYTYATIRKLVPKPSRARQEIQ